MIYTRYLKYRLLYQVLENKMSEKVLKISTGCIKGEEKTTALNSKHFYSFKGIPYAEPPTGEKRFKDPVPCKPWQGVRDATKHGNICPQFHEFLKKIVGDEDCLFINVYTPKIPDEKSSDDPLLPVMVYIHGGGFTFGSGNDELYGPDYIIEHNVVLVTLNYRVGVFGFFSLGNSDAPGNAGLKDQSLALKWVSENIKYFGGDCNNVTLFGESAGAASVQYHTLSPLSTGLFHRVILQSGSALNPWAFFENPVPRAFNLGEILGNKTTDASNLVKFLRDQPSETLVVNQGKVLSSFEKKKLTFPFVPCKEVVGTGNNFITETPEMLLKSGKFSKVPYIIGMNDKEGLINLKEETDLKVKLQKISVDPERFIPHDMLNSSNAIDDIFKRVKHFYFGNSSLAEQTLDQYVDLWTDIEFSIGINKSVKYLLSKPDVPVYLYLFTFEGQLGYLKAFIKNIVNNVPKGVCHADDLGYVFHNSMVTKELPVAKDSPEVTVVGYFSTFWTNFAKNSDPNDKKYNCEWKKTSVENPQYLDIGEVLKIICTSFVPERLKFWENLYESQKLTHKL